MYVEFWDIGATSPIFIPMTPYNISSHLLLDWVPWLPTSASSSLMGWPSQLIESVRHNGSEVLALREELGRAERQWKGMLSWMLGVAGARHVLKKEGYRWIAPLSAFYPEAIQSVNLSDWPTAFPPSSIKACRQSGSVARFRPDYIAVKPTGEDHAWTVAEAKGTSASLAGMSSCPRGWYDQVRNVKLRVNGSSVEISRYLVLATRANPNAVNSRTRRLQVRCWNSMEDVAGVGLEPEAAVAVASAHLFGLFRNLRMPENARAIALSTQIRFHSHSPEISGLSSHLDIVGLAENEISNRFQDSDQGAAGQGTAVTSIDTDFGTIAFEFARPLMEFVQNIRMAFNPDDAVEFLRQADNQLDDWERTQRVNRDDHNIVILPFGVRVLLPPDFGNRG